MQPLTTADWKLVLLLAAINFTHILDFVIVMPLGDQLRHDLSITPQQFGYVVSAYGLAAMVAGVATSAWMDRWERKRSMLISFAGFVLMTFYCGVSPNFLHLVTARALAGLFGGTVSSVIMAYIVDSIDEQRRGRAIGIVTSSFAFASTIGLPIGLSLADWFANYGAPFIAIAVLGCGVWVLSAWLLPRLQKERLAHPHPIAKQFVAVLRHPNHLWSFAFMLAMVFSTFMIVPYIAPYFQANCGMSRSHLPLVYLVGGIGSLFSMNGIGWLTDRFGPRSVFMMAASGAIFLTLIITHLAPVGLVLSILIAALFMSVASSRIVPAQAMMLRSAEPSMRGAFTSLNTAVSHFATGTGPLISGSIIGEAYPGGPLTNYGIAGWLAASFGIVAIILSFQLRPSETIRLEHAPSAE